MREKKNDRQTLAGYLHDTWDFSLSCSVEEDNEGFFLLLFLLKEKMRAEIPTLRIL
jgi:hypothetical protein